MYFYTVYFRGTVASPGFVARRGRTGDYVMGHSRWTLGLGAAAARWLIVLWLMQYWSKELWVVDVCTSWSRRLHNTWIVGCQIYTKVKKWNCWKCRGHVPHCPLAGDATAGGECFNTQNTPLYEITTLVIEQYPARKRKTNIENSWIVTC